jgi:hypothetical protein
MVWNKEMDWNPTSILKQWSNKTAGRSRISTTNRICRWHHRNNKKTYSEVYKELKERAKEVELNIIVEKTKPIAQNKKTRWWSETLMITDHDIEVV